MRRNEQRGSGDGRAWRGRARALVTIGPIVGAALVASLSGCVVPTGPGPTTTTSTLPSHVSNGKLAFRIDSGGMSNIYTMNRDGSGLAQLTNTAWNDQASWSFDGTKVAFTRAGSGQVHAEIWVMDANGSNQHAITSDDSVYDLLPSWSPDGTKIAFRRDTSSGSNIWVMNADGSGQHMVSDPSVGGRSPTWSSGGGTIVYTASVGGAANLVSVDVTSGTKVQLTQFSSGGGGAFEPSFSYDGSRLSFTHPVPGTNPASDQVWTVNADGSDPAPLTNLVGLNGESTWAPDDTAVAFVHAEPNTTPHLYVIGADGSDPTNLTPNIPTSGIEPAWQPVLT